MPPIWLFLVLLLQVRGSPPANPSPGRGSITGIVMRPDAAPGTQQVPNARVELRPAGLFAITDGSGKFFFRDVPPGRYTLLVHREGLVMQEDSARGISPNGLAVTLNAGQTIAGLILP